jgi:hypothetical protein
LNHTATLLSNGKVLVAGGWNGNVLSPNERLDSTELYDPITQVWTASGNLNVGRFEHRATLLTDGQVLVAGGDDATSFSNSLNSAELFDSGHRFENHHLSGLSEGLRASDALGTGP